MVSNPSQFDLDGLIRPLDAIWNKSRVNKALQTIMGNPFKAPHLFRDPHGKPIAVGYREMDWFELLA